MNGHSPKTTTIKRLVPRSRRHRSQRFGAVLVGVLACIMVTVALIGSAIKVTLAARRDCKADQQMLQAEMLLQAAIDRLHQHNEGSTQDMQLPSTWDASPALTEFVVAKANYQVCNSNPETVASGLADQNSDSTVCVQVTALLYKSDSPSEKIQLSRTITLKKNRSLESNADPS